MMMVIRWSLGEFIIRRHGQEGQKCFGLGLGHDAFRKAFVVVQKKKFRWLNEGRPAGRSSTNQINGLDELVSGQWFLNQKDDVGPG